MCLSSGAGHSGKDEGGLLPGHGPGRGTGGGETIPGREELPGGALAHGRDPGKPHGGSHVHHLAHGRVSEGGIPVPVAAIDPGTGRVIVVTDPGSAAVPLLRDLLDPRDGGTDRPMAAAEPAAPPGEGAHRRLGDRQGA